MAVSKLVVSAHRNLLVVISELVVLVSFQSPDSYTLNSCGICLCGTPLFLQLQEAVVYFVVH